ncbi:MAG: hypothetical protein ACI9YP_001767, partial [Colwellia sp.]
AKYAGGAYGFRASDSTIFGELSVSLVRGYF